MAKFNDLIKRIDCAFPNYRSQLVKNELNAFQANNDQIEDVKYTVVLNVLIDLCQQGWQLMVQDNKLTIPPPSSVP